MNYIEPGATAVTFHTVSGDLYVVREGNRYVMDLPRYELKEIPVTDEMEAAFGYQPIRAILGLDLICVFENEEQVRNMNPDQKLLAGLAGRLQNATARGQETDCVSRSFCPELAVPEDTVCGSAHCQIADYWSKVLGKDVIEAYQASERGGYLHCQIRENSRIAISGEAVLVAVSELAVKL
jgi:predicted PhzF superfamily epimerase YddE/YHI9